MLLTDDELDDLYLPGRLDSHHAPAYIKAFARAVIAACEAKLREQEPSYWANPGSINHVQMLVNSYQVKGYVPLYLRPAPSVPEGITKP